MRVYIGLPESLKDRVLWVKDEYRKHPWSLIPGGNDIVVEYHNAEVYGYDKVKITRKYVDKIFSSQLIKKELKEVKSIVSRIFARKYSNNKDYKTIPFKEIWNSASIFSIQEAFENYDLEFNDKEVKEFSRQCYGEAVSKAYVRGLWKRNKLIAEGKCSNTIETAFVNPSWKEIKALPGPALYYLRNSYFDSISILLKYNNDEASFSSIIFDKDGDPVFDDEDYYRIDEVIAQFDHNVAEKNVVIKKGYIMLKAYANS